MLLFPRPPSSFSLPCAAAVGALTAWLGFAPIGWWWVPYLGFTALAALLQRTRSVKLGAAIGCAFGLGYFLAGVSWVRVSLADFGGMPLPMAWFAAFLLCAMLAAYPLFAGAVTVWIAGGQWRAFQPKQNGVANPQNASAHQDRSPRRGHEASEDAQPQAWLFAFVFASSWTFAEYLRAHLFTGFEWLSVGTSQAPGGIVLVAQVLGTFGATWVVVFFSGLAAGLFGYRRKKTEGANDGPPKGSAAAVFYGVAVALTVVPLAVLVGIGSVAFSANTGKPLRVSLLQGNVAQSMKWEPEKFVQTLQMYERLITQAKGELIILPETALPAPLSRIPPEYIERLRGIAFGKGANLLLGVPLQEQGKFYNAAVSLGVEDSQQYRKVHLVPFGEYMPLRAPLAWFYANLTIPMSDFSPGDAAQAPIKVNGQTLGISICYEDSFARDVLRTLPDATVLVNMSNDAWFGKSAAAEQHLQLSQMRAIEQARPMLRANNTGITAVIDEMGRVTQRLEPFAEGLLEATVQGRTGATPYMMWGDLPLLLMCLAGLGIGIGQRLRNGAGQEAS